MQYKSVYEKFKQRARKEILLILIYEVLVRNVFFSLNSIVELSFFWEINK